MEAYWADWDEMEEILLLIDFYTKIFLRVFWQNVRWLNNIESCVAIVAISTYW